MGLDRNFMSGSVTGAPPGIYERGGAGRLTESDIDWLTRHDPDYLEFRILEARGAPVRMSPVFGAVPAGTSTQDLLRDPVAVDALFAYRSGQRPAAAPGPAQGASLAVVAVFVLVVVLVALAARSVRT